MTGLTPDIIHASVPLHGVFRLTFADGVTGEVYVLDRMRGPVFERAVTPKGYGGHRRSRDRDSVLAWRRRPRPDTLYERVRTGAWPGQSQAA